MNTYEEVDFSGKYTLRWMREGDEYVNKITKEMMDDFKDVARQQQAEIEALKKTVDSLFNGLESSLALNKAQAQTYDPKKHGAEE
jgi:phosphate uptake regulator